MKKELTNRDRQAIATKNKIFKIGVDLIREHGFDGINVKQIVNAAGVSIGTFYHYYDSKLDLFMDMYRIADTYYEEDVAAKLKNLSVKEKIHLFFKEYCILAEDNGVELTKKMYIPDNTLFLARTQGMHNVLFTVINDAIENNSIKTNKKPQAIADELFLIARGVIFDWSLRNGEYDLEDKMDSMLDSYLATIL